MPRFDSTGRVWEDASTPAGSRASSIASFHTAQPTRVDPSASLTTSSLGLDEWACPKCILHNTREYRYCPMCSTEQEIPSKTTDWGNHRRPTAQTVTDGSSVASSGTVRGPPRDERSNSSVSTVRPRASSHQPAPSSHDLSSPRQWQCSYCTHLNALDLWYCLVCNNERVLEPEPDSALQSLETTPFPLVGSRSGSPDNPIPMSRMRCVLHGEQFCDASTCRVPPSVSGFTDSDRSSDVFKTASTRGSSTPSIASTVRPTTPDGSRLRHGYTYSVDTDRYYDSRGNEVLRTEAVIDQLVPGTAEYQRKNRLLTLRGVARIRREQAEADAYREAEANSFREPRSSTQSTSRTGEYGRDDSASDELIDAFYDFRLSESPRSPSRSVPYHQRPRASTFASTRLNHPYRPGLLSWSSTQDDPPHPSTSAATSPHRRYNPGLLDREPCSSTERELPRRHNPGLLYPEFYEANDRGPPRRRNPGLLNQRFYDPSNSELPRQSRHGRSHSNVDDYYGNTIGRRYDQY